MDLHLLHLQFLFHYLKISFASWVWATAELCPPSSCHVHCPAAGCGWALCSFGLPAIRMNPDGHTQAYRTGPYFTLFLPPAPPRNWVLLAFLPLVAFLFPTTLPASPKLGQDSRLSLPLSTCCQHSWPGMYSWFTEKAQSPWVLSMLFPLWSGWCWSCALLLFPQFYTPETAPPAFLPLPVSSLQLWELAQSAAGWKHCCGSPWVGRWEGGREGCLAAGEAGCWSRQRWWGQLQLTRLVLWHFHAPKNLFWSCQRLHFHMLLAWNFHSLYTAGV